MKLYFFYLKALENFILQLKKRENLIILFYSYRKFKFEIEKRKFIVISLCFRPAAGSRLTISIIISGSKTEFLNMFERPIMNGQCIDSTEADIKLMRYRAHVLHSLLVGFVQRRSHRVLQTVLPQKEEYVLLVRLTTFQRQLYDRFMNEVVRTQAVPNPLKAFAVCCKIWNHPDVLYNFLVKRTRGDAVDLDLDEVAGAIGGKSHFINLSRL